MLMAHAQAIAVGSPAVMSQGMAEEMSHFTNDMTRAAEYVLSHLR